MTLGNTRMAARAHASATVRRLHGVWRRGEGASCEDPPVAILLEYGGRRFQVVAYHDAIRHDGPALELAELVDGELGPALVTVLFPDEGTGGAKVLLADSGLPLRILTAFIAEVVQEEHRIRGAGLPNSEQTT
ncbi:hypothetical protein AB0I61_24090 [Polymorphospora rubra]|uniref:hypothetical protein n=1 Tax=Polymorphospora rubra TaxID=338584 RepID=UPI00340AA442